MKRYIKIGMENKNNDISNKLLTMMIMLEIGSVLSVRSSDLEFSSVDMLFLSAVRVQKLFFWRPKNIANPKPSFFSFKSFIENPKMKVSIMICIHQPRDTCRPVPIQNAFFSLVLNSSHALNFSSHA